MCEVLSSTNKDVRKINTSKLINIVKNLKCTTIVLLHNFTFILYSDCTQTDYSH